MNKTFGFLLFSALFLGATVAWFRPVFDEAIAARQTLPVVLNQAANAAEGR